MNGTSSSRRSSQTRTRPNAESGHCEGFGVGDMKTAQPPGATRQGAIAMPLIERSNTPRPPLPPQGPQRGR